MSETRNEAIRRANFAAGVVLAETLARLGATFAAVSPGSRSTPLTLALAMHPEIEAVPVLDERSAAFLALGWARRTGRPGVVVVTSGTAAANLLPAVAEAREGRVPLLVLTADRPPELRARAAGQTIDQTGLYGRFPKWQHELPLPEDDPGILAAWRQALAAAVSRAVARSPGPVHLNVPFREPLVPAREWEAEAVLERLGKRFWLGLAPEGGVVPPARPLTEWPAELSSTARGLIVAGPAALTGPAADAWSAALARVARATGWPVLAEALNPARGRADVIPGLVTAYDSILRGAEANAWRPEVVLQVGPWPTSKVLRAWLEAAAPQVLVADDGPDRVDALALPTRELGGGIEALAAAIPATDPAGLVETAWVDGWRRAEAHERGRLAAAVAESPAATETRVALALLESLPPGALLVVANSMPVRDLEWFRAADARRIDVLVNRGANGIDGTLSTALGAAWGADRPVALLTGDLAFLHDSNGLLSAGRLRGALLSVVVDNRGGGIFGHLPVAAHEPPFEEMFATPQAVDLLILAAAHGVAARNLRDEADLRTEAAQAVPGVRLFRWKADRHADAAWRKRVLPPTA